MAVYLKFAVFVLSVCVGMGLTALLLVLSAWFSVPAFLYGIPVLVFSLIGIFLSQRMKSR